MAVVVARASAQSHVKLRAADKGQMAGAGRGHGGGTIPNSPTITAPTKKLRTILNIQSSL